MIFISKLHSFLKKNGIKGISDRLDAGKDHFFLKILFLLEHKYLGLRSLLNFWLDLDKFIPEKGLSFASRLFVSKLGLKVKKNCSPEILNKSGKPVIFIGINHEAYLEPFLVFSILERNDIKVIAMKPYQILGQNFSKHILPVMIKKYARDNMRLKHRLENKIDLLKAFYRAENLTKKEIESLNRRSFNLSVKFLQQGGALVIFPAGGYGLERSWGNGIGEIIKRLGKNKRKTSGTVLTPVIFKGLTAKLVRQQIRTSFTKKAKRVIPVDIIFLKPFSLKQFMRKQKYPSDPRQITQRLRKICFEGIRLM